ncbi:kelch-like protein 9 [Spea bombifrons]|uniref:kelch-like protein 9 n=1 Tax=Spea bombifrons TaxID=233779 RepID=UPI0023499158|nr:kelch-like protein 9 [Spea bombifrons]
MQNGSDVSTFTSEEYPGKLLGRICQLRSRNELCDVTLEADGVRFPAHRIILASASTYCKLLFADSDLGDTVRLKDVTPRGLRNILEFIYSSKLSLSLSNVEDTIKAAEVLLVREAIKLCFQFLEDGLNQDNCVDVLNVVEKHGPEELRQKAMEYVGQRRQRAPEDFDGVDKTTLCEILDRKNIPGYSELDLFNCAVSWLQRDDSRLKEAGDVLKRIRFSLIPLEDLQKHVKETPIMKTHSGCFRYLQDALRYHSQIYSQPALGSESSSIRSSSEKLLVLGGRTADNQVCGNIWVESQDGGTWTDVGELRTPVYNHCVAVVNDFLFVIGGQSRFDPSGKHPSNEVFRFDPRNGSWLQVAGMLERRTRFHTEVVADRIIAVGGGTLLGNLTHTAEEYQPAKNKWEFTAPFPMPVADHAGATHKGILYISGGYSAGKTSSDVYSYLPRLRRWVVNRAMAFARCDHGMAAIGDTIFCIGGRTLNAANEWIHVNETEFYSPVTDQWGTLKTSSFDCCQFSVVAHRSKLYLTGGGSLRCMNKEDSVFIYDPEAETWRKAGCLPRPLVDHASCTIKLPHHMVKKLAEKEDDNPAGPNRKKSTLKLFITSKPGRD